MKKGVFRKISYFLLGVIITAGCFSGCSLLGESSSSEDEKLRGPDYSQTGEHFSFYAYAPPGDGYYTVDGQLYPGKQDAEGNAVSFQTVEKFQEYKDCGFDTIMFQADDPYTGNQKYEESHVKDLMDMAHQVGLKAIIFDSRIHNLSAKTTPIVGEGCAYATQKDLQNYVAECMKDYTKHPAFYGLLIRDEPTYEMLSAVGAVYRAIKANHPDCFIQCNLFPLDSGNAAAYKKGATVATLNSSYKWYLEEFVNQTGADYVMMDSYPMHKASNENIIKVEHLKGLEICTTVCKEKGVRLFAVAQTSAMKKNGILRLRACEEADMYWQTNLYMGMGVKQVSYYTYQRKRTNSTSGEYYDDGTSFIRSNGEKTKLYDWMQNIHGEMQSLATAILNFEYAGIRSYVGQPAPCNGGFLSGVKDCDFTMIQSATTSAGSILLITELYDKANDQYMYMIMNAADPSVVTTKSTATVSFGNANDLLVYDKGERSNAKLKDGKYTVSLNPGHAVFVLPF